MATMREALSEWQQNIQSRARKCHKNIPGLRRMPLPAIAVIGAVAFANALAWVGVGITLV